MPSIDAIARFLDETLSIATIPDYSSAVNGLQLANLGDIQRVACAVDFSTETVTGAVDAGARLLVVQDIWQQGPGKASTRRSLPIVTRGRHKEEHVLRVYGLELD